MFFLSGLIEGVHFQNVMICALAGKTLQKKKLGLEVLSLWGFNIDSQRRYCSLGSF